MVVVRRALLANTLIACSNAEIWPMWCNGDMTSETTLNTLLRASGYDAVDVPSSFHKHQRPKESDSSHNSKR